MTEILEKVSLNKPVYAMSEPLSSSELINVGPDVVDPHIWFDLKLWERCVRELAVFLSEQFPSIERLFKTIAKHIVRSC